MPLLRHVIPGFAAAAILSLAAANPATAGDAYTPPPTPPYAAPPGYAIAAAWSACNFDVQRYCYAVPPGQGRIVRCLRRHWWRLRPVCRAGLLQARDALGY